MDKLSKIKNNLSAFNLLLFILFLVAIIGIFRSFGSAGNKIQRTGELNQSSQSVKQDRTQEDIQKLLDEKKSVVCEFSTELPGATISGTIYINGENNQIRTDLDAPDREGNQRLSHTLYKGDNIYVWYESDAVGMALNKTAYAKKTAELKERFGEESVNDKLSYFEVMANMNENDLIEQPDAKCKEWQYDEFLFILPPKINFVDTVNFYTALDRVFCQECDKETTEASRLLCRQTLKCK